MEDVVSAVDVLGRFDGRDVLITGHTGFKGSWLALWLKRLGATVTGFSDSIPTQPSHFARLGLEVNDVRGDICDPSAVEAVVAAAKPDVVFHLAAQSLVRRAYCDPLATYRTNVLGTVTLLEATRRNRVPSVVIATTDKVYRNDESGRRYREEDELGGSDPYSSSKSCVELLARSYRETLAPDQGMLIATVRAGNVIGGGDWADDRLIPDLMKARYSGTPAVVRHPQSTRPWQHVLDVLAGYLAVGARMLDGKAAFAGAWNFGPVSQANTRVQDLLQAIGETMDELAIEIRPDQSGHHESALLQLDSSKALRLLGWKPLWEGEMIERTLDWYRAYYERGVLISNDQIQAYEAALRRP